MHPPSALFCRPSRRAFSLVEILVTTAIMGILAAMLVGGLKGASNKGKDAKCMSNLRQIGMGIFAYVGDNDGYLPRPTIKAAESGLAGDQMWSKQLGPYLPQRGNSATAPQNKVFICPSAKYAGVGLNDISSSYNSSSASFYFNGPATVGSATSGPARSLATIENPSKTIFVTEGKQAAGGAACQSSLNWTDASSDLGQSSPSGTADLDFRHDNKMNALYGDGHVATISFKDRAQIQRYNWEGRNYPQ